MLLESYKKPLNGYSKCSEFLLVFQHDNSHLQLFIGRNKVRYLMINSLQYLNFSNITFSIMIYFSFHSNFKLANYLFKSEDFFWFIWLHEDYFFLYSVVLDSQSLVFSDYFLKFCFLPWFQIMSSNLFMIRSLFLLKVIDKQLLTVYLVAWFTDL